MKASTRSIQRTVAQQMVNRLRRRATPTGHHILFAAAIEGHEFGDIDKATWIWWIACGGGLGAWPPRSRSPGHRDVVADQRGRAAIWRGGPT